MPQPETAARRLALDQLANRFNEAREHIPRSTCRVRAARRALDAARRTRTAAAQERHAVRPEHVRRHVQPDEIDEPFVPRRRVQRGPALEQQRCDAALAERCERARRVPSSAATISAPRASSAARAPARGRRSGRRHDDDRPGVECREQPRAAAACAAGGRKSTRISGRSRNAPRAVSSGSSARMVPTPTPMASTSARIACACAVGARPTSAACGARARRRCSRPGWSPPSG